MRPEETAKRRSGGPVGGDGSRYAVWASFVGVSAGQGFTVIELMFGMVITVMVLGSVTALGLAVGEHWEADETPQQLRTHMVQGARCIQQIFRDSRYIGWTGPRSNGSGWASLFWMGDDGQANTMEAGDIGLLEYDAAGKTVKLYRLAPTAASAGTVCGFSDFDKEDDIASFKKLAGMTSNVILRDVKQFNLWAHDADNANSRPMVEFVVELEREGERTREYQTAALRTPYGKP